MAEGGLLAWKVQKIKSLGKIGNYGHLQNKPKISDVSKGKKVWRKNDDTQNDESKAVEIFDEKGIDETTTTTSITSTLFSTKNNHFSKPSSSSNAIEDSVSEKDEWEVLSDWSSSCGIRSLNSGGKSRNGSINSANSNPPRQLLERSTSNSTIGSDDFILPNNARRHHHNPTTTTTTMGTKKLGIDYVEHVVLPTDTLQGLCLQYRISATRLRQANHFSGTTLLLAPKKLIVPLRKGTKNIKTQDTSSREFKIQAFLAERGELQESKAMAYLEMADWDLAEALSSAQDDIEWEVEEAVRSPSPTLVPPTFFDKNLAANRVEKKSGEIRIRKARVQEKALDDTIFEGVPVMEQQKQKQQNNNNNNNKGRLVILPTEAILPTTVTAMDVHKAQPDGFGLEMKDLMKPPS